MWIANHTLQDCPDDVPLVALVNMTNIAECSHIAFGLQQSGLLSCWYTSLYYRHETVFDSARLLPGLKRRHCCGLDGSYVRTLPAWEMIRLLVSRLPVVGEREKRSVSRACKRAFTRAVSARLTQGKTQVVIGVNGTSMEVFERAKELGAISVLVQRTQHPVVHQLIVENELRRRGIDNHRFLEPGYRRYVERCAREVELADYVLCPSRSVIESMQEQGIPREKLILRPYGVDVDRFSRPREELGDGVFRILYVGRVGYPKGIAYLIEAFEELKLPNSELVLIGHMDGTERSLPNLRIQGVKCMGWLPPEELDDYFMKASVFVLPSLSEGSALVSYEAMAAGLPVVATSASGAVLRDGQDGFVVPPRDVEALKRCIGRLYRNPGLRVQMGEGARRRVRAFSWAAYRRQIPEIVLRIWRSSRGRMT